MTRLAGKVAIVTGGSRGMGEATVRLLVEQGARVLIGDVLDDAGEALAAELGDAVVYKHMDVTNSGDWENAVKASEQLGPLNVLVNNAAIIFQKTIMDTTEEDFMKIVSVNQLGVFLGHAWRGTDRRTITYHSAACALGAHLLVYGRQRTDSADRPTDGTQDNRRRLARR